MSPPVSVRFTLCIFWVNKKAKPLPVKKNTNLIWFHFSVLPNSVNDFAAETGSEQSDGIPAVLNTETDVVHLSYGRTRFLRCGSRNKCQCRFLSHTPETCPYDAGFRDFVHFIADNVSPEITRSWPAHAAVAPRRWRTEPDRPRRPSPCRPHFLSEAHSTVSKV